MDGQNCDGGDSGKHGSEQNEDKPCGAFFRLGRGLGDAHRVDEGVRDEQNELHGCFDEESRK